MVSKNVHVIDLITTIVLVIGGINWGLVGLFDWNFISSVFGFTSVLTRTLYSLVGIAAVYKILTWVKTEKSR